MRPLRCGGGEGETLTTAEDICLAITHFFGRQSPFFSNSMSYHHHLSDLSLNFVTH